MLKLREHQEQAVSEILTGLDSGKSPVMYTGATGCGKTAIAASLVKARKAVRTLFVAPSLSIVGQLPEEMGKWGVACSTNTRRWKMHDTMMACTYISAWNRIKRNPPQISWFDMIIIDEAHHAYDLQSARGDGRIVTKLVNTAIRNNVPVVGLTATLWLMSPYNGFDTTWKAHVEGPSWPMLSYRKMLASAKVIEADESSRIVGGEKAAGEYTDSGIAARNQDNPLYTGASVAWWEQHKRDVGKWFLPTIVYAAGQRHGVNVANLFSRAGHSTGLLLSSGEYLEEADEAVEINQRNAIDRYRDNSIEVLVNVKKVTEGFDAPASNCVLFLRPTMSLALWVQACGRGSRIPVGSDKELVYILDAAGNTAQHGRPDSHFEWSLQPRKEYSPQDTEGGVARFITCPKCKNQIPPPSSARPTCPVCEELLGGACQGGCGKWHRFSRMSAERVCQRCSAGAIRTRVEQMSWQMNPREDSFDDTLYYPDWVGRLRHMDRMIAIRPRKGSRFMVQIGVKVSAKTFYVIEQQYAEDEQHARALGAGWYKYAVGLGDSIYERLPSRYQKRMLI